ncbi:helix-turn-helix transcriptional regulator [Lysobacter silvisoli]|uniref:AraC family transcriptional regulator n=1 Tax=Lysobacter silvisoli TaxID=2293254 RepID=A0A371K001_9GAMM|nr:AraC family transcriptional regulator [Lysobacter silvisoli]RDZ27251.1 AraC family transcriptional regulator [Lysobacter silvisoli]
MSEFEVTRLLDTGSVAVRHVLCHGRCRHRSAEECASSTHLVFPYRGLYLRHVGQDQSVADANHALLFNAGEGYQVSHPVTGGDASLVLSVPQPLLRELAPAELLQPRDEVGFRRQSLRIDPRAQALVALLRHGLQHGGIEPLEAESLALTLLCRSLGPRTTHATAATQSRRRLVNRVKVLLAGDPTRRWSLEDIAAEIGGSAVYLTQAFQQVEGLPLYRYHLRLRLARALDLIPRSADMSALALDLGFSSHSHFSAAFKQAYGRTPSAFRRSALAKSA